MGVALSDDVTLSSATDDMAFRYSVMQKTNSLSLILGWYEY